MQPRGLKTDDGGRLAYVDGLRAVAVLFVMIFHARVHMPGATLGYYKEFSHGVDLFFVVSGFCLAIPTLKYLQRDGFVRFDVAAFAVKRFLRIFPPYAAAVLGFAFGGWYALAHGYHLPPGMASQFDWSDVLSELFFMDRGLHHINSSFWSLAVECRWYVLFPAVLALWAARPRAFMAMIVIVILANEATRAASTDIGVLDAFLLGIVAAHIALSRHPAANFGPLLMLAGAGLGLMLEGSYHFPIQTNAGWHLTAFGFVIWAGARPWLSRALSHPWLTSIGIASYSIYLVHEPIVSAADRFLAPRIGVLGAGAAAIALGVLGGYVLWVLVELPATNRRLVAMMVHGGQRAVGTLLAFAQVPTEISLGKPQPFVPNVELAPAIPEIEADYGPNVIPFRQTS